MSQNQPKTLPNHTIVLMIVIALFFDLLQMLFSLMGLGLLIIPIFYMTYILWFLLHGLNFLSLKRAPTLGLITLFEGFSAGIVPGFTFLVARIALDFKVKNIVSTPTSHSKEEAPKSGENQRGT